MTCELSTMNNKLDSFSQCLIENTSCQSNNENKIFYILHENVKFLQKELLAKNNLIKSLVETKTAILKFVSFVTKNANESGKLHQEQNTFLSTKTFSSTGKLTTTAPANKQQKKECEMKWNERKYVLFYVITT